MKPPTKPLDALISPSSPTLSLITIIAWASHQAIFQFPLSVILVFPILLHYLRSSYSNQFHVRLNSSSFICTFYHSVSAEPVVSPCPTHHNQLQCFINNKCIYQYTNNNSSLNGLCLTIDEILGTDFYISDCFLQDQVNPSSEYDIHTSGPENRPPNSDLMLTSSNWIIYHGTTDIQPPSPSQAIISNQIPQSTSFIVTVNGHPIVIRSKHGTNIERVFYAFAATI